MSSWCVIGGDEMLVLDWIWPGDSTKEANFVAGLSKISMRLSCNDQVCIIGCFSPAEGSAFNLQSRTSKVDKSNISAPR